MRRKTIDPRKRRVVLAMDATRRGGTEITKEMMIHAAELIAAIVDRQNTEGLHGHQKNYAICRAIARLRISLDQGSMIWSSDNIDTFERTMIREMESIIREKRNINHKIL